MGAPPGNGIGGRAAAALLAVVLAACSPPAAPLAASSTAAGAEDEAATALVAAARAHAAVDRHEAAVRAYQEALARRPELADDLAQELAWQQLWRDNAPAAAHWFRRHLARAGAGAGREARRGLALALSWSGDQPAAIDLYGQLLAEEPGDGEARLGLGRSLMWDNRLQEGYGILRALEDDPAAAADDRRAGGDFLLTALDGYDMPWEARLETSHDSDGLDMLRAGARAGATAGRALLAQATSRWTRYRQDDHPEVTGWRFGAGAAAPLGPTWQLHAYGWVERLRSGSALPDGDGEPLRWTRPGGDAWLTWRPAPGWRWDFGAGAQPVETMSALAQRIWLRQGSLSCDRRLASGWTLSAAALRAAYSDDNRRWLTSARLTWRREGRLELAAGPALTWLDFERAGSGYWSPDWMRNVTLEAAASTRGRRWTASIAGRYGYEKEPGSAAISIGGISARWGWRLAPGALVVLDAGHARSRLASSSGYNRDHLSLAVRGFF